MAARPQQSRLPGFTTICLLVVLLGNGCVGHRAPTPLPAPVPRELLKTTHPIYFIEPPDIIQIDLITAVPKPPYRLRPLDVIGITVPNAFPDSPITGPFTIEPNGTVYLGGAYGSVDVSGLTIDEARSLTEKQLAKTVKNPLVNMTLIQTRATQQVRGPHLVRADGTIGLGLYGSVMVVGMTIAQAKTAIETHLKTFLQDPEVSVDVVGYNSKIYYVVFDYGGAGQQVVRLPITGNETVLDGIAQLNGLPTVGDKRKIWVSRPSPDNKCPPQVLPVDWNAIVERGETQTNYQLLPGDRVFVKAIPLVATDVQLARIIAPIERIFGIVLLGSSTVNQIRTNPNENNGSNFNR